MRETFLQQGYAHFPAVLTPNEIDLWRHVVVPPPAGRAGRRDLFSDCPDLIPLAVAPPLRRIAESLLGSHSIAVRAVLFDKTPQRNWKIHWHQDSIIAVRERRNAPGFVGWSQKDGVWHVQPPAEILADMVALRIHLDDASSENGPLRVLPGSHRVGWIEEKDLPQWRERVPEVVLPARTGDVLAMKPLLLHASAPSQNAHHRRVVHVEFACRDLPAGLTWFEQW